MKAPRKVIVKHVGTTWAVAYVERRKHQRHWAAQFDLRDHTEEEVREWVRGQAHLELVERIAT